MFTLQHFLLNMTKFAKCYSWGKCTKYLNVLEHARAGADFRNKCVRGTIINKQLEI